MDSYLLSTEYLRLRDSLLGQPCRRGRAADLSEENAPPGKDRDAVKCPMCGTEMPGVLHPLHQETDRSAIKRMQTHFPGWLAEDGVCGPCLVLLRTLDVVIY